MTGGVRAVGRLACGLAGALLLFCALAGCDALRSSASRLARAQTQFASGDAVGAMAAAKLLIEKDPKFVEARLLLADAALAQDDRDTVQRQLDAIRQAGAGADLVRPREWALMRVRGDFEGLARATAADTAVAPAVRARFLGQALLGLHQADKAAEAFARALALAPDDPESLIGRAQAQFLAGQRGPSIDALKSAMARFPHDGRIAVALAQLYVASGRSEDAAATYAAAIKDVSPRGDLSTWFHAQSGAAQVALSRGHLPDADKAVAALAASAPRRVGTLQLQARLALAERRLDDASRYAQAVVRGAPGDVPGQMLLAYITYAQGYLQQAETSLNVVLADHGDFAPARKLLAEIQLAGSRPEVARRTIAPLLAAAPDGETLTLAGRIASALGERTEAETYFSKAVDAAGASDSLKLKVAAQYLAAGNRDRAIAILDKLPSGSELAQRRDLLLALAAGANLSPEAARRSIDEVAARYEDDPALQRSVAMLHAARGDFEAARSKLEPVLKAHPNDVPTLLTLARIEAGARHYDDAAKTLGQVLAREPKNVDALVELGSVSLQRGDAETAIRSLESARAADPKAIEARLALARVYLGAAGGAAATLELARAPLKEALALAPARTDALVLAAILEKRSGNAGEAERILKDALHGEGASSPLWLSLGDLQASEQRDDDARDSYLHALALTPGWLPAVKAIAALDVRRGAVSDALAATARARKVTGQSDALARQQLAGALLIEGDVYVAVAGRDPGGAAKAWKDAAQSYERAYEASPSASAATRVLTARVQARLPAPEEVLAGWVRQNPADVAARTTLANYFAEHGDRTRAVAIYEQGLVLAPAQPVLLNNVAWLYLDSGDPRALPTARKAVEAAHHNPQVVDTLGWVLVQQGKLAEGAGYLAQAYQALPRDPEIAYHYAYAAAKGGKAGEARQVLAKLLADSREFSSRAAAQALDASLASGGSH